MESVFDILPDGFFTLDPHWRFTDANQQALHWFGRTREQLLGQSVWDVRPELVGTAFEAQLRRALAGDARVAFAHHDPHAGVRLRVRARPLPDGGVAVTCEALGPERACETALEDLKRDEERRQEWLDRERAARAEADAANAAKDRFLAVLSHELRTPLTPVLLAVSAMEADPNIPDYVREDLLTVRRNIDLETRLIDDLLDLSRVTTGKLRLTLETVGVHHLLRHVLEVCASDLLAKRLQLVFDLKAADDHVVADPARLQQVFWNLLKNAIKFTPEHGRVAIRTRNAEPGRVEIEVKDSGAGIAADVLPRIFDAFEQGDPTVTRQFGGLGLGLAISKAIIDLHGGALRAASGGPRRGATFTVDLAAAGAAPAVRPSGPSPAAVRKPISSRVLLVEDHRDTANVLAKLLARHGYRVRIAHSVAAALELAAVETFDVVVSDIGLPDATGYELMEQLRDRYGAKGIALSGFGMDEDMKRSRDAGFVDHVTKPVDAAQLEAVLRRVTAGV